MPATSQIRCVQDILYKRGCWRIRHRKSGRTVAGLPSIVLVLQLSHVDRLVYLQLAFGLREEWHTWNQVFQRFTKRV